MKRISILYLKSPLFKIQNPEVSLATFCNLNCDNILSSNSISQCRKIYPPGEQRNYLKEDLLVTAKGMKTVCITYSQTINQWHILEVD